MTENSPRVCLRLTDADYNKLQGRAKGKGRLVSEIARDAIREYLAEPDEGQQDDGNEEREKASTTNLKNNTNHQLTQIQ